MALTKFFPKRKVFVADDRYTAFSIYRYHDRMVRKLQHDYEHVGELQRVAEMKEQELRNIDFGQPVTDSNNPYDLKYALENDIKTLRRRIQRIVNKEAEHEYYSNSCKFLTEYCTTRASLNEFERGLANHTLQAEIVKQSTHMRNAYETRLATITREYLLMFFPDEVKESASSVVRPSEGVDEGALTCFGWSYDQIRYCVSPERHYNYKRINHFREYLKQQQGESRIYIAPELLDDIRAEIRKRYVDPERVSHVLVKKVLKRDPAFAKYHEHSMFITRLLNKNYRPMAIEAEHECKLCQRFAETEAPFEKHKHDIVATRKNFMSYPFVAYKLCELEGYDQYLPSFKLLKSVHLLILQDEWWSLICKELNWQVIRTVGREPVGI